MTFGSNDFIIIFIIILEIYNYFILCNFYNCFITIMLLYWRQCGLILNQNYFELNNKIYQQNEGLAMGSPLSCITAEIFLQHINI